MKRSRLMLLLVGMLMVGLLTEPIWAAPGQDRTRQTVPTSTPSPTATPGSGTLLGTHIVQPGETLYCIGRAYGVDPYEIALQNIIINPNLIYPGQAIEIPWAPADLPPGRVCAAQFGADAVSGSGCCACPTPTLTPTPRGTATPTPTPCDACPTLTPTLTPTPTPTVCCVCVTQPPVTPTLPPCSYYHRVAQGENLYRLSLRYGVSLYAIAEINAIPNIHFIRTGWVLCIP